MFIEAAVLIILLLTVINGYVQKNRQLPGPFPLPLIGGAYIFLRHASSERILPRFMDLVNKYGRTFAFRLGSTGVILVSKPEHVQLYCTSPHLLDHSALYDNVTNFATEGLFAANGASWKAKRKAWTPSFHPSLIRTFVKTFKDQADIFLKALVKEENGPEFPLYPYLEDYFSYTLSINQFEFDPSQHSEYRKLIKSLNLGAQILYKKIFNVFFHNDTIFKLSAGGKQIQGFEGFCREYVGSIAERQKVNYAHEPVLADDDLRKKLFLRQLLLVRNPSKQEIIDEIGTFLIGGYETTSHVMGFVCLMLGRHQEVQERVYLEDQEIQRNLNGQELTMDDLGKYEYLNRVIKETMRLFPPAPIMARQATKDVKMGDITIPKGSTMACLTFALHRDPKIYPNPLEFNPDNFLPERIAERHPYSYIPFSGGPRNCVGLKYGMTSLKVIVSTLVRKYRLFSSKDVEDIKLTSRIVLGDVDHFILRIEER